MQTDLINRAEIERHGFTRAELTSLSAHVGVPLVEQQIDRDTRRASLLFRRVSGQLVLLWSTPASSDRPTCEAPRG